MSSQRVSIVILVICATSVFGKPLSIDVFENKDVLLSKKSFKRTTELENGNDIAELSIPKISLSAFLDNLESSLVRTALSAESVVSDPSAQMEQIVPTAASVVIKRSVVESEEKPIVLVQTTEKVSAADTVPAHVVIDRVSVFKAPLAGAALLPTFHFQQAPTHLAVKTDDVDVEEDTFLVETTTISAADGSSESESSESSEESREVSSTVSSSSTTPVDEKKAVEKELKEKIAEVEADPVILTARV